MTYYGNTHFWLLLVFFIVVLGFNSPSQWNSLVIFIQTCLYVCVSVRVCGWEWGWDRTTIAQSSKGHHMVEWRTVPQWLRWNNFKNGGLKANREKGNRGSCRYGRHFQTKSGQVPQEWGFNSSETFREPQPWGQSLFFVLRTSSEDFELHSAATGRSSTSHIICEAQLKIKMQVSSFYND